MKADAETTTLKGLVDSGEAVLEPQNYSWGSLFKDALIKMHVLCSHTRYIYIYIYIYMCVYISESCKQGTHIYEFYLSWVLGPGVYSASNRNEYQKH
jgi:hypothetical protein